MIQWTHGWVNHDGGTYLVANCDPEDNTLVCIKKLPVESYVPCCLISHTTDVTINTGNGWWRTNIVRLGHNVQQAFPDPLDPEFESLGSDDFAVRHDIVARRLIDTVPEIVRVIIPALILH